MLAQQSVSISAWKSSKSPITPVFLQLLTKRLLDNMDIYTNTNIDTNTNTNTKQTQIQI